jgi:hypothetical protein
MELNGERGIYWLLAVVIIALIALNGFLVYRTSTCNPPYPLPAYTQLGEEPKSAKTIVVSGTGSVFSKPDLAYVTIAVQTQSKDAQSAQQDNARKMTSTIDTLKSKGISENDVRTVGYRLDPMMDYESKPPVIVGYLAVNTIQITVRDLNNVGKIIDTAVSAGANVVQNIQFAISKDRLSGLRNEAIVSAIEDARKKAEATSKSLGVELIGPTEVSITPVYEPGPILYKAENVQTPVTPGELEISSTVQVSYLFK